ncbi:MAG: hypothetical protein P8104_01765 [Gammaproteobacteria bacterium]
MIFHPIHTNGVTQSATTTLSELSKCRWRISYIDVTLKLGNAPVNVSRLARAVSQFEDFSSSHSVYGKASTTPLTWKTLEGN